MTIPASGQRQIRRSKKAFGRFEGPVMLAAAVLCAAAVVAALSGGRGESSRPKVLIGDDSPELVSLETPAGSDRPIYRHSVIPGGVYTPEELKNALVQDAVAATHYRALEPSAVRAEVVKQDRFAYVSYRKDDQIYWTRNKVRLSQGETILTDGTNEIRARCGNCISETPQLPVAAVEPDSLELDQLVDDPGDPLLAAAIRAALDSPASGLSGSAMPGAFGAGPAGGGGGGGGSSYGSGGGGSAPSAGGGGGAGGSGGIGPSSLGSGSPSFGGPGSGEGQPGISFSSPGPGDPGSPGDQPSADGPDSGGPTSGSPGGPGSGGPTSSGPGPDGPTSGAPESPVVPAGLTPLLPPGVDPPPGYNPPPGSESDPPTFGPEGETKDDIEAAAVPEPGTLFLLGGGAAAVLLRKLRSRS